MNNSYNIEYQDSKHNREYSLPQQFPQQFPQQNIVYMQQDPQLYQQMNPQQQQQFYPYQQQQQYYVQQQGPLIISQQQQTFIYPEQFVSQPINMCQYGYQNGVLKISSRYPIIIICPFCNKQTQTVVKSKVGMGAVFLGLFLCFIFPPCFFIPFFIKECHELIHKCGNCGHFIYKKCC